MGNPYAQAQSKKVQRVQLIFNRRGQNTLSNRTPHTAVMLLCLSYLCVCVWACVFPFFFFFFLLNAAVPLINRLQLRARAQQRSGSVSLWTSVSLTVVSAATLIVGQK